MTINSRVGRILIIAAGFALMLLVISIARETVGQTPPPVGPGDWVIPNGDSTIITADTVTLEGNLIIKPTGELILNTVVLEFDCSSDGEFGLYNYGVLFVGASSSMASAQPANAWTFQIYTGSNTQILDAIISQVGYDIEGNSSRWGLQVDDGATADFIGVTYSDCERDGINIDANNVTVVDSAFSAITETAIVLSSTADDTTIENNTIDDGMDGIISSTAVGVRITENVITNLSNNAVTFYGSGFDARVDNNTLDGAGNGDLGIWTFLLSSGDLIVENNTITDWTNGGVDTVDAGALVHYNNISFCKVGLNLYQSSISRENRLWNNSWGIKLHDDIPSTNDSIYNSTYYDIKSYDGISTLTNTSFEEYLPSADSNDIIAVRYYLDVRVVDQASQPVDSATVTVDNEAGTRIYTRTTGADGWTRWMIVGDFNATSAAVTHYNPYTITGTKDSQEGQVTVNLSGASRSVVLKIASFSQRRSIHVNIFNAYNGLGLIEELLVLEFSLDGVNWTRSDTKDLDLEYVWGGTVQLRLKDFYNVTVSTVSLDMDSPTAPATDPEGITRQGVSEIFWDASIPILTINVDPPYDLNDWILELNGEEVGFSKKGSAIQIRVLGGLKGDMTHRYILRWPKQPIVIDNGTVNVSAGQWNITAEGDETRKIGHISVLPTMKLAPDYEASKPAKSSEYSFFDFLQEYWLTVASMAIAIIVGFIGYLRYKQAKRTNELLGDDRGGGD